MNFQSLKQFKLIQENKTFFISKLDHWAERDRVARPNSGLVAWLPTTCAQLAWPASGWAGPWGCGHNGHRVHTACGSGARRVLGTAHGTIDGGGPVVNRQ
jgi:hypothetical protein